MSARAAARRSEVRRAPFEERFLLTQVPWSTYVVLRDSLDEQGSRVRMTYLDGSLELMSPSFDHEDVKTILARLVEAYAEERDLPLNGYGSTTFRAEAAARGVEPDECYCKGRIRALPDVAIEIVFTPPRIDKLKVYEGLGVPEVWLFEGERLSMFLLSAKGYRRITRSRVVTGLTASMLLPYLRARADQLALVKAFRRSLRGKGRK